jgi:hypothetical protein
MSPSQKSPMIEGQLSEKVSIQNLKTLVIALFKLFSSCFFAQLTWLGFFCCIACDLSLGLASVILTRVE